MIPLLYFFYSSTDTCYTGIGTDVFDKRINAFIESGSKKSPIWIFFSKKGSQGQGYAKCQLCGKQLSCKSGSTSAMSNHIHHSHNVFTKYDASKRLKELRDLKEQRRKTLEKERLSWLKGKVVSNC